MRPEIEIRIDMILRFRDLEFAYPLRLQVVGDGSAWGGFLRVRGEGRQGLRRVGGWGEYGCVSCYICGWDLG
jgi:hypothetical protein